MTGTHCWIRVAAKIYKTGCHIAIVDSSEQDSQGYSQENSKNKEELEKEKPEEVKIEDILSKNITKIIKKNLNWSNYSWIMCMIQYLFDASVL